MKKDDLIKRLFGPRPSQPATPPPAAGSPAPAPAPQMARRGAGSDKSGKKLLGLISRHKRDIAAAIAATHTETMRRHLAAATAETAVAAFVAQQSAMQRDERYALPETAPDKAYVKIEKPISTSTSKSISVGGNAISKSRGKSR